MPETTVLMPVFNGADFLRIAIESILKQSYSDFEFLIIDDGSTDATAEIVKSFKDKRIRFLQNQKRLKLSGALNRGLDESRGEYIARMDADDIARPYRLREQIAFLKERPDVGICGGWPRKFGAKRSEVIELPITFEQLRAYAVFDSPLSHPTVVIRKRLFERYDLKFDGNYYPTEDYELWTRALEMFPCVNIPKVLMDCRVHESSMTGSDWNNMDLKATWIVRKQLDLLGVRYTEENLLFHRNMGCGPSCRSENLNDLDRGHAWLNGLVEANRKNKRFDESTFTETAALIWYRFCMNADIPQGFKAFRKYVSSQYAKVGHKRAIRTAVLFLSIVKKSINRYRIN